MKQHDYGDDNCMIICDMIKGNESDVGNIVLEILAKKGSKFFCFILFSAIIDCL